MNIKFSIPVRELVEKRVSCRTYDRAPLGEHTRGALLDFIKELPRGPFGSSPRLGLVDLDAYRDGEHRLGTYGVIRGAATFIAGATTITEKNLIDYGYLFEAVILRATELGLGTCWLGGTLTRDAFAAALGASEGEIVPAISPAGTYAGKRSITDQVIRWSAGSGTRKPWVELFFDEDFSRPLGEGRGGIFAFPLEMVRRAPSASNKQPWRILLGGDGKSAHLFLQRSRGYNKLIRAADLQLIDMGIAMCHFDLALGESGERGSWTSNAPFTAALPERTQYIATWKH